MPLKKQMHRRGCPRKRGSIEVSDHEIKSAITVSIRYHLLFVYVCIENLKIS